MSDVREDPLYQRALERAAKELDVERNGIGDAGAVALAKAVESGQCQLTSLNVAGNRIGEAGAGALAEAVASGQGHGPQNISGAL